MNLSAEAVITSNEQIALVHSLFINSGFYVTSRKYMFKIHLQIEVKISTSDITEIVHGQLTGDPDLFVKELLTDSRQSGFSEGLAFFAIRGINHDGHVYIDQLYKRGIRIFIIEDLPADINIFPRSAFIKVSNTIDALQDIAAYKRKQFDGIVIAVTGSAGKTIVKNGWLILYP